VRSNPAIKAADRCVGRAVFAALGALDRLRPRPAALTDDQVRCVLAIKLCCLGDGILAVPALRALKARWPHARLVVVCTPRSADAFSTLPFVDQLEVLPITGLSGLAEMLRNGWQALPAIARLRRLRPAVAVDLDLYYRATPVIAYLSSARVRVGFDTEGAARAGLFTASVPRDPWQWELECFLDVIRLLGIQPTDRSLEYHVSAEAATRATELLTAAGLPPSEPYIALCPGSSKNWPTKQWPPERFAAVADWALSERGLRSVLIGAGFERELCQSVAGASAAAPLNTAGQTSVPQTAALLRGARGLVSNDTGPMHLACAVGTPVVAIFGPTRESKWAPHGPRDVTLTHPDCDCRPCYHLSYMPDCDHRRCLMEITVERVTGALAGILDAPEPEPAPEVSDV
jgi:heptosyltransferase I